MITLTTTRAFLTLSTLSACFAIACTSAPEAPGAGTVAGAFAAATTTDTVAAEVCQAATYEDWATTYGTRDLAWTDNDSDGQDDDEESTDEESTTDQEDCGCFAPVAVATTAFATSARITPQDMAVAAADANGCSCPAGGSAHLGNYDNGSGKPANTVNQCRSPAHKKGVDYFEFDPGPKKCRIKAKHFKAVAGKNCDFICERTSFCLQTGVDYRPGSVFERELKLLAARGCTVGGKPIAVPPPPNWNSGDTVTCPAKCTAAEKKTLCKDFAQGL